jgi:hypothetical protein
MKRIYLDSTSRYVTVTDEVFSQVEALVNERGICLQCQRSYTEENPKVARNLCKACFLRNNQAKRLEFVGASSNDQGESLTYQFIDPSGYIYLSKPTQEAKGQAENDIPATLRYWNFPVPTTHAERGETFALISPWWNIYGDFKHNAAVVITYHEYYGKQRHVTFLTYKGGSYQELNRRKREMRDLLDAASKRQERSLTSTVLYEHVSDIASEKISQSH